MITNIFHESVYDSIRLTQTSIKMIQGMGLDDPTLNSNLLEVYYYNNKSGDNSRRRSLRIVMYRNHEDPTIFFFLNPIFKALTKYSISGNLIYNKDLGDVEAELKDGVFKRVNYKDTPPRKYIRQNGVVVGEEGSDWTNTLDNQGRVIHSISKDSGLTHREYITEYTDISENCYVVDNKLLQHKKVRSSEMRVCLPNESLRILNSLIKHQKTDERTNEENYLLYSCGIHSDLSKIKTMALKGKLIKNDKIIIPDDILYGMELKEETVSTDTQTIRTSKGCISVINYDDIGLSSFFTRQTRWERGVNEPNDMVTLYNSITGEPVLGIKKRPSKWG